MKAKTSLFRPLVPVAAAFAIAAGCGGSDDPAPSTDPSPTPDPGPAEVTGPENLLALDFSAMEPEAVEILSLRRDLVREAPGDAEAWARYGMALHANGRESEAIESYQFASSVKPDQPRWRYLEALALWSTGDRSGALAGLRQTLELRDDYSPAHRTYGYWLNELSRFDEAQAAFERALEIKPSEAAADIGLALIHLQRGELKEGLSRMGRVLKARPDDAYVRGLMAKTLRNAGRHADAQALAAQGTSNQPSWWDPWLDETYQYRATTFGDRCRRATALYKAGKFEQALEMQRQLLVGHPEDAQLLYQAARSSERLRRHPEAVSLVRECLEHDPEHVNALCMLGKLLGLTGESEEAFQHLDRALALAPEDPRVHFYRGSVLRRMEDLEGAVAAYRKSLALNPESATTWVAVGNIESELGNWDESLVAFEAALAAGIRTGEVYLGKAEALLGLDRLGESWEALQQVVKDPRADRTRFNRLQTELRRRQEDAGEATGEDAAGGEDG